MTIGRVLLIHFQFPPAALAGAKITAKFAKYLPAFGWEPFVLTAQERYYPRVDPTTLADIRRWDRVYRTRKILHPRQLYLGVKAMFGVRHPERLGSELQAMRMRRPILRRTLSSLLTTPDDLTGWIPLAIVTGLHVIRKNRIDRLFSSGPPWSNHLVAYVLKRFTGLPWAACFEDPWTQTSSVWTSGEVSSASLALERWLERAVVRMADSVICLNDFHREALIAEFSDLPQTKFVTISNGYDPEDFPASPPTPPLNQFVITHGGAIDYNRTPEHLFIAARRCIDREVISAQQLRLRFVGPMMVQAVRRMAEEHGLERVVDLSPPLPHRQAIHGMQSSHLLLLLAHDCVLQIPTKAYEYLRAGRPILALAPEGATADFIRRSDAGVVVDPYDVEGITEHLRRYLAAFGAGRPLQGSDSSLGARFDRRSLTAALASLLSTLGASSLTSPVNTGRLNGLYRRNREATEERVALCVLCEAGLRI